MGGGRTLLRLHEQPELNVPTGLVVSCRVQGGKDRGKRSKPPQLLMESAQSADDESIFASWGEELKIWG